MNHQHDKAVLNKLNNDTVLLLLSVYVEVFEQSLCWSKHKLGEVKLNRISLGVESGLGCIIKYSYAYSLIQLLQHWVSYYKEGG